MTMGTSKIMLLLLLVAPAMAADLVLTGAYAAVGASMNDSMYLGKDGVIIHDGDHFHDPCNEYVGVKFTTSGNGQGQGDGFIVINDCQIVRCKKWTNADGSKFGGETVIFDIVDFVDSEVAAEDAIKDMRWSVLEESLCIGATCNEDCYTGKFLHVEDYDSYSNTNNNNNNNDCEASPGSIACSEAINLVDADYGNHNQTVITPSISANTEETNTDPTISEQVTRVVNVTKDKLSPGAIAGIAIAAVVVFLVAFYYCCCCRSNRNKDNKDKQNAKEEMAAAVKKQSSTRTIPLAGEAGVSDDARKQNLNNFASARRNGSTRNAEAAHSNTNSNTDSSAAAPERSSWFGKNNTSATSAADGSSDTDEGSQEGPSPTSDAAAVAAAVAAMTKVSAYTSENTKKTAIAIVQEQPEPMTRRGRWFSKNKANTNNQADGVVEKVDTATKAAVQEDVDQLQQQQAATQNSKRGLMGLFSASAATNTAPTMNTDTTTAHAIHDIETAIAKPGKSDEAATSSEKVVKTVAAVSQKEHKDESRAEQITKSFQETAVPEGKTEEVEVTCCAW